MSTCCGTIYAIDIPGPEGTNGAPGAPGADGVSSYTTVANYGPSPQPVMPQPIRHISVTTVAGNTTVTTADTSLMSQGDAVFGAGLPFGVSSIASITDALHFVIAAPATASATNTWIFTSFVTVNITSSNAWASVGEPMYVESWGTMFVASKPSASSIKFYNPEDATTGFYGANANAGISLAAGKVISPGGAQGPAGAVAGGALLSVNNLNDVANGPASFANIGGKSAGTFDQGNANGQIPRVDLGGGLISGRAVFATPNGLETKTNAATLSAIGGQPLDAFLTSIATLGTAADKTIYTTGVDTAAETALTAFIRTLMAAVDAAAARAILGVSAGSLDMLLYRHQAASGSGGGGTVAIGDNVVPINVEVVDQGNHGSITGSRVTLDAGTYRYSYGALTFDCGMTQGWLVNFTDASTVITDSPGTVVDTAGIQNAAVGQGRFTIAAPKAIELHVFSQTGKVTTGFGKPGNSGKTEVWSYIAFWKE